LSNVSRRYSYLTGEVARPLGTKNEPRMDLERTEQEFSLGFIAVVQTLKGADRVVFANGESRTSHL